MTRMTAPWAYGEVRRTDPTRRFDGELELTVGERQVRLVDVGSAHSPGDTYVHLPADQLIFAGDLLFIGVAPVMWIGPVTNWIAALDEMASLDPATIVPGHGPVGTAADLGILRDYWAWAVELGELARASGTTPAAAAPSGRSSVPITPRSRGRSGGRPSGSSSASPRSSVRRPAAAPSTRSSIARG